MKWANTKTARRWESSCEHCLRVEGRGGEREADSHMNCLCSSFLMTPTVPFLPKARITIKPESHLLTWSPPSCPRFVQTHAQARAHTQKMVAGERRDEREVGWGFVTGRAEGMCRRMAGWLLRENNEADVGAISWDSRLYIILTILYKPLNFHIINAITLN